MASPPLATSRTYQYRKVMKPLLEIKRRAGINKCLDELKHLIMELIEMDADTLAKLEKADILELTVHHLHRQQQQHLQMEHFWRGSQQCTLEVSHFLQSHNKQLNDTFFEVFKQILPEVVWLRTWLEFVIIVTIPLIVGQSSFEYTL
ncbi:uncharacterized protein Dwil_GK19874 [Drosophila willistoni]|uniref:BHLH domain-containing protein n=1 Tax=Drosophila willistoni TaxID=7260 RepID=B4MSM5_DROWI|nr:uncharacterized protein Dwil_GK19874 [Drosophila willistoni]